MPEARVRLAIGARVRQASITEARNNFSALVDGVKHGTSVLIVERGRPVARLEPVAGGIGDTGRLADLIRVGIVRPPRSAMPKDLFDVKLSRLKRGSSVLRGDASAVVPLVVSESTSLRLRRTAKADPEMRGVSSPWCGSPSTASA